jgi:carbonic anhydrase
VAAAGSGSDVGSGSTEPATGTLDPAWRACLMGKAQSPIDIEPRAGTASPITFHYRPTAAVVFDEGHTLQVQLAPGSAIEIDGHAYQLLQFHFHMPSEHAIAGEHYPLELHLVHQDTDGRIAVVGVLYDTGTESKLLAELWSRWPRKVGGEDKPHKPFDPGGLLPETRTVFRYTGSLTTPPCTEGVMWNVMRRAMSDTKAHLDEFARHYPHNARELQPLGDRKIL